MCCSTFGTNVHMSQEDSLYDGADIDLDTNAIGNQRGITKGGWQIELAGGESTKPPIDQERY